MAINTGANVSKLVGFVAAAPVPGVNLLKLVGYVVLVLPSATGAAAITAEAATVTAAGTVTAPPGATGSGALTAKAATISAGGTAAPPHPETGTGAITAEPATLRANGTAGRRPVSPGGGGSLPAGPAPAKGKSMSTTVSDLIHSAMRLIGAIAAGETLETVELNDAFVSLNQMLASWNTEGASLVARKKLTLFIAALNAYSLPERPVKIDAASAAISGVDNPLEIVDAAGWEAIPIPEKAMQSIFLRKLYCDYGFPTATVYVWPIPRVAGQLELWIYATVPPFQTLDDPINLPDGYEAGLRWNLAVNLAPEYGRPLDQVVAAQAQSFKASLVQLNAGNHMKSQAAAPAGVTP